jgi:hypothetical protein
MSEDAIALAAGSADSIAIAFIIAVAAIKITAFVIGYLIVRLGHDTLVKGITGDIDFGIKRSGFEVKLISASPGAFFVLAGAAIIIWGLFVDKPFDTTRVIQAPPEQTGTADRPRRELPE